MKLKLLLFLGLFTICSSCEAMYIETALKELIEKTVNDSKKWKINRAVSEQTEFLKEKGGEEAYFEEVKKALLGLADVALSEVNPRENVEVLHDSLKKIYEFGIELSKKVSESSEETFLECAFEITEYYYKKYDLFIDSENNPRLKKYIDYLGNATNDDWGIGS